MIFFSEFKICVGKPYKVNVASRIADRWGINVKISNSTDLPNQQLSLGFFKQLLSIATGEGSGNHAVLTKYDIHSITLRALQVEWKTLYLIDFIYIIYLYLTYFQNQKGPASKHYRIQHLGRLVESFLRSENNLLERLHASIWFYIFSSVRHYSSISLYMPIVGMMLLLPAMTALQKWINSEETEKVGKFLGKSVSNGILALFLAIVLPSLAKKMAPKYIFPAICISNIGMIWKQIQTKSKIAENNLVIFLTFKIFKSLSVPIFIPTCLTAEKPNSKGECFLLLIFTLQTALISLVCFSQGLPILITGICIVLPLIQSKTPKGLVLIAHPVTMLVATYALYMYLFSAVQIDYSDLESKTLYIFNSENSNLYNIWMFSVLPVWSSIWAGHRIQSIWISLSTLKNYFFATFLHFSAKISSVSELFLSRFYYFREVSNRSVRLKIVKRSPTEIVFMERRVMGNAGGNYLAHFLQLLCKFRIRKILFNS